MKNLKSLLATIVICSVFTMCEKDIPKDGPGKPQPGNIYVYNQDILVEANNMQMLLPATEIEDYVELEIVSSGLHKIEQLDGTDEITLNGLYSDPPSENELYEYNGETLYKQKIQVEFKHNRMAKTRTATFRLLATGCCCLDHYADITFIQYGHN